MRNKIIAFLALALLSSACSKTEYGSQYEFDYEQTDPSQNKTRISLSMTDDMQADSALQKTYLRETRSYFDPKDLFSVFDGSDNNNKFKITYLSADKTSCTITGYASASDNYIVVYPYQPDAQKIGESVKVNLPSIQEAVAGSYNPETFISVAYTQSDVMQFRNICSLMKFESDNDYSQVKITSLGGEPISGDIILGFDSEGNPEYAFGDNKSSSVALQGTIKKGSTYYLSFLPSTLESGLLLELTPKSGPALSKAIYKEMKLNRNKIYKLEVPSTERTVYFVSNGGVDAPEPCLVQDENIVPSRGKLLYENHKYLGWSTNPDSEGDYMHQGDIIPVDDSKSDVIVYAMWKDVTAELNGHEYVDLGLESGILWGTMNIGATKYNEPGDYFAWGETESKDSEKSEFWFDHYKWNEPGHYWPNNILKYNRIDNITELELEDDAARAQWQGGWRIPSKADFEEALQNCGAGFYFVGDKRHYRFVSRINGKMFYLYPCGVYNNNHGTALNTGNSAYWTSTFAYGGMASYKDCDALVFSFYGTVSNLHRACGVNVRPVL